MELQSSAVSTQCTPPHTHDRVFAHPVSQFEVSDGDFSVVVQTTIASLLFFGKNF